MHCLHSSKLPNSLLNIDDTLQALGLLFDPEYSMVRLRSIRVAGPRTIEADYVSGGYLRFPWHPRVEPYEGQACMVNRVDAWRV